MNAISDTAQLVSVIIPCYNHGHYLPAAIESALKQTYSPVEIIVVDDGSKDNTEQVASNYQQVKYIFQHNLGLSASRNTGIKNSTGAYIIFLDADDWLYPEALEINLKYLKQNEQLAFVSGAYDNVYENKNVVTECKTEVNANHYEHFLDYNYVGMISVVLFRRRVFDEFLFDTTLKSCEDHDLYLKISRKYPVMHHQQKIAAYRRHSANMSSNIALMLSAALTILKRQQKELQTEAEKKAYKISYNSLYKQLNSLKGRISKENVYVFKQDFFTFYKLKFFKYLKRNQTMIKSKMKKSIPFPVLRKINKLTSSKAIPRKGRVMLGDFDRTTPFSKQFGFDRGGAIDRYYIENFLEKESVNIHGRVLEIGDNSYTLQYGGKKVSKSDILHVDEKNAAATFIGDISNAPQIPDNIFDCIIFTQTLHLIYDFKDALKTCHRILKPGGTLLLTVPGITPIDHDEWNSTWYWSFTDKAFTPLMAETFPQAAIEVNSFGNVFVASAFLYGMGLPEVPKQKLDYKDPYFQVIITVKAVKK